MFYQQLPPAATEPVPSIWPGDPGQEPVLSPGLQAAYRRDGKGKTGGLSTFCVHTSHRNITYYSNPDTLTIYLTKYEFRQRFTHNHEAVRYLFDFSQFTATANLD